MILSILSMRFGVDCMTSQKVTFVCLVSLCVLVVLGVYLCMFWPMSHTNLIWNLPNFSTTCK